jgi:hypothetical protein
MLWSGPITRCANLTVNFLRLDLLDILPISAHCTHEQWMSTYPGTANSCALLRVEVHRALWHAAELGDHDAVLRCLRVAEERTKLLNLV